MKIRATILLALALALSSCATIPRAVVLPEPPTKTVDARPIAAKARDLSETLRGQVTNLHEAVDQAHSQVAQAMDEADRLGHKEMIARVEMEDLLRLLHSSETQTRELQRKASELLTSESSLRSTVGSLQTAVEDKESEVAALRSQNNFLAASIKTANQQVDAANSRAAGAEKSAASGKVYRNWAIAAAIAFILYIILRTYIPKIRL